MNTYTLRRSLGWRFLATATLAAVFTSVEVPLRHFTAVKLASLPARQLRDDATAYASAAVEAEWMQIGQSGLITAFALVLLLVWAPMLTAFTGQASRPRFDAQRS